MLDAEAFAHWSPPVAPGIEPAQDGQDDQPTGDEIRFEAEDDAGGESAGDTDLGGTAEADPEAPGGEAMTVGDFSILASPTISLPAFTAILRNAGSPAAPEAIGIYNAAVSYGVDPAVLLAVYQHESNFGKAGVAKVTKGIGNLRYYPASAALGATKYQTASNGSFAAYTTYTQAAADTSRLLASSLYGKSKDRNTVRTFPFRWAPAADHNKPAAYGASLAANIARWTGKQGSAFKAAPSHPAGRAASGAATAVKHATTKAKAGASGLATGSGLGSLPRSTLYIGLAIGGAMLLLLLVVALKGHKGRAAKVED